MAERFHPDAAVGIATDRLREEFGAAVFKAQARIILDRVRYCLRGNRAAAVRRATSQHAVLGLRQF